MSTETNIEAILQNIEGNMQLREGLKDTPDRVVRMYKEVFDGYRQKPESFLKKTFDKLTFVSYTIVVTLMIVKSPFASCRKNRASYHCFS